MNNDFNLETYYFGADFIIEQVSQLESEINGTLIGGDIEYVHRMRVASRRLRSALKLFTIYFPENCAEKWRKEMKGITRALGNARDLDIQIQLVREKRQNLIDESCRPGYERLLLRLSQQRTRAQQKIISAIHSLTQNQTLDEIRNVLKRARIKDSYTYTPSLFRLGEKAINDALMTFLSFQAAIQTPNNIEELHAMRIAGKHLRYTMEIFKPMYEDPIIHYIEIMKKIQDQLGEIHDCDVWIGWLPEFIEQEKNRIQAYFGHTRPFARLLPGIDHLLQDRKQKRQEEYQAFLSDWQMLTDDQSWEKLREAIQTPEHP